MIHRWINILNANVEYGGYLEITIVEVVMEVLDKYDR